MSDSGGEASEVRGQLQAARSLMMLGSSKRQPSESSHSAVVPASEESVKEEDDESMASVKGEEEYVPNDESEYDKVKEESVVQ